MSFIIGNAIAQNTSTVYPNNTETIQDFEGNNTAIFKNDTNTSNPANDLEDSLSINE